MLSNNHFYHRTIRKMVVAFGTIFNNIRLIRYDKAGTTEIERITVPLIYANKEKFYERITQDPELTKETMLTLPRMSFSLDAVTYDPLRKTSIYGKDFKINSSSGELDSITKTPYNFSFSLSIYVRNVEDGTQIVEQILPYFNPDYNETLEITVMNQPVSVPIILNTIDTNDSATGLPEETRTIVWTLSFTVQGYIYGPVNNRKIIRKVKANTYYFNTDTVGTRRITLTDGSGNFKVGEMVYEGYQVGHANATAFVESWDSTSNTLVIVDSSGLMKAGHTLRGAVTNASWNIASFVPENFQLTSLEVTPNPPTANANDDFGFTETWHEYI